MKVLFRIIVATIFCLIVISVITYGQVKRTWTGSVSNDWCTPGNWNPVGAPTSNDTAVINSGTPTFSCTSAGIKVLILTGGTLSGDSTLTISGTFNWSGGTMTGTGMTVVDTGGSVNITSGVSKTLNGRTLTLRSSVTTVCTGSFTMSNGAVLANWGTLNIQADINIWTSGSPSPRIDNYGTFRKSNTAGITQINVVFNNIGTVQGYSGTIQFYSGGTSNGEWNTGDNAYIDFTGGTYIIQTGTSFTGTGFARVNGATVNVNGTIPAVNFAVVAGSLSGDSTLTISGTFNWSGGTMAGTGMTVVDTGGSVNITSAVSKTLNGRTLTLRSSVTTVCTGSFTMSNGAVLANWGTLNIQADINIWTSGSPSPRIDNYGTFRKSNTAGITNITIVFYNYGAVKINTGTLYFTGGYTQITGETILGGGDLAANGTINILGGSLSGFGDINASVNNAGKVNPGDSLGCLKIMGTYSQTSTGGIDIQIRGRNVCSQFDKLIITGNATFQGKLNIALINPFRPIDNDSFQIISYGTRTGKFDTVSGLNIGSGFRFDTLFTSNFVTLKCIAPLNTLPIASNDTVITPENKPISISVLKNDSDADGDTVILYKFYQQI